MWCWTNASYNCSLKSQPMQCLYGNLIKIWMLGSLPTFINSICTSTRRKEWGKALTADYRPLDALAEFPRQSWKHLPNSMKSFMNNIYQGLVVLRCFRVHRRAKVILFYTNVKEQCYLGKRCNCFKTLLVFFFVLSFLESEAKEFSLVS